MELQKYDISQTEELKKVYIRLADAGAVFPDIAITTPEDAIRAVGTEIRNMDKEMIYSINLRSNGTPINVMLAGVGKEGGCLCSPASLIRAAILSNASSMIMVHNHPSGELKPSAADIKMADRMIQICKLHEIDFLDSVIVAYGKKNCYSMKRRDTCDFYYDTNQYAKTEEELVFPKKTARSR